MRLRRIHPIFSVAVAALVLALAVPLVHAQTQATSGDIQGTVMDQDDDPLPGVTITVTNEETGRTRTTVTNAEGYYRVPLLPPGTYTVRAELEGFQTVDRTGIRVTVGSLSEVNVDMPLATVEEVLIVTGEAPIVETSKAHVSATIGEDSIDSLPILGRDFSDFTLLTPGATLDPDRGTVSISGQRGVNTSVNIDGTSANSAFFGYQRGGTDSPFTISLNSVREFEVITSGVMPEFGRSGGGLVNVVTKSGTNTWRGGGHLFLRDEALTSEDPFGREQEEFSVQQFGGNIGGPLVENKSFIFGSVDFQKFETPFFVEWPETDPALIQAIGDKVEADLGFRPEPGRFTKTNDAQVYFVKWDHAIARNHTLTVRYNLSYHETQNASAFDPSGTTNFDVSAEGTQDELTNSIVAQITSVFGDNAFNEFRVQYANDDLDRNSNAPGAPFTCIIIPDFQCFGKAWFLPINVREDKWQVQNNFSYLFGDHDLKVGIDIESDKTAEFFANAEEGWWFFLFPEQFADNRPLSMEQFFGPLDFPTFEGRQTLAAVYAQDSWKARDDLTVNFGIRWEGTFNPTPPNPNPAIPETSEIPNDLNNWQPRVGVAWSPDERTVVRGSAGLFYSRTPMLLFFDPFTNNGRPGIGVFEVNSNPFGPPGTGTLDGRWPNKFDNPPGGADPGTQQIFWFDPDFGEAATWRFNFGVEREIFEDLSLGASFVHQRVDDLQMLFDHNLLPGGVNANGRFIYANDGFGPIRPVPNQEHRIDNNGGYGRYNALILDFEKRFGGACNCGFFGSYTLAKDEDNDSNERSQTGPQPSNIFDLDADFGTSDRDIRHRVVFSGYVDLPYDFRVSGIFTGHSGRAWGAFVDGEDLNFDGSDENDRPVIGGEIVERNAFDQPNFYNIDMRVMKRFDMGQAGGLDVLLEVFNLFNVENEFITNNNFLSSGFGEPTSFIGNVQTLQIGFRYTR